MAAILGAGLVTAGISIGKAFGKKAAKFPFEKWVVLQNPELPYLITENADKVILMQSECDTSLAKTFGYCHLYCLFYFQDKIVRVELGPSPFDDQKVTILVCQITQEEVEEYRNLQKFRKFEFSLAGFQITLEAIIRNSQQYIKKHLDENLKYHAIDNNCYGFLVNLFTSLKLKALQDQSKIWAKDQKLKISYLFADLLT